MSTNGRRRVVMARTQLPAATTGRAIAIASNTLFWMPRASRRGATTAAACCR